MRRIDTPIEPGLFGYSMPNLEAISFVYVYRTPVIHHSASRHSFQTTVLRSKTVGSTYVGDLMKNTPADGEWYKLNWWDRLRFAVAKKFRIHNWPKRTLRVKK